MVMIHQRYRRTDRRTDDLCALLGNDAIHEASIRRMTHVQHGNEVITVLCYSTKLVLVAYWHNAI